MQPPLPSPVPTWHNDTYQSISPSRPELSVAGKTVIVTGAGSGIGQQTALTYASAGASKLVLIGRNESNLTQTQNLIQSQHTSASVACEVFPVSVTDEKAMQDIASKIGPWDIMILGAGFCATPSPLGSSVVSDWWQSFETNVKGIAIASTAFLPTARPESRPVILSLTTIGTMIPAAHVKGLSAYVASKAAGIKAIELLAAENPDVFCASVHPGMVETATFVKSGSDATRLPMDKVELPAHFLLWMASPEAGFLNGRTVFVNWDVDELKAKADEIQSGTLLTMGLDGWPFKNAI